VPLTLPVEDVLELLVLLLLLLPHAAAPTANTPAAAMASKLRDLTEISLDRGLFRRHALTASAAVCYRVVASV
jgi:hypothetical protein